MGLDLSVAALALAAVSGVPGLALPRDSAAGQTGAAVLLIAAALAGSLAALVALLSGAPETARFAGPLPELPLHLRLDPLAAFFLLPIYVLGAAGSLYGIRYWRQSEH